jgi:hypothetical protein
VVSGGLADVPRVRARGLDFVRGLHRNVEREAADSSRAARSARMRRRRRAARQRNFGERLRATRGTGSNSSDASGLLTSKRSSGTSSRRRRPKAATALGFRAAAHRGPWVARARVRGPRVCGGGL